MSALFQFDEALKAKEQIRFLAGIDESGRGPLAGPVVAAVVVLKFPFPPALKAVRDSKILSPASREDLFMVVRRVCLQWAVGWALPHEIDRDNILQATFLAMRRAFARLSLEHSQVLAVVDGPHRIPALPCRQTAVVSGDSKSLCVASASIIAKVIRDRWMQRLHYAYPEYGFAAHKGYGTAGHLEALNRLGPSPVHRTSFAPVARALRVAETV